MGCKACTEPQCLYKVALYLRFYCTKFNRPRDSGAQDFVHPLSGCSEISLGTVNQLVVSCLLIALEGNYDIAVSSSLLPLNFSLFVVIFQGTPIYKVSGE